MQNKCKDKKRVIIMAHHGSLKHQEDIRNTVNELEKKGYRAVYLEGKAPDAVATKDNKLYAIEILHIDKIPKKGWGNVTAVRQKKELYSMFDEIIIRVYEKPVITEEQKELRKRKKEIKIMINDLLEEGEINDRRKRKQYEANIPTITNTV